MTRSVARWGCFLPDLTRLASGSSTTNLPIPISAIRNRNASPDCARNDTEMSHLREFQGHFSFAEKATSSDTHADWKRHNAGQQGRVRT